MKRWFALSAIGRDRPGIVADLAGLIYECDCNLEDSSMTVLGSEFAVLLLLSCEGEDVERRLSAGCKRLEWEKRLTVFFRPLEGDGPPRPAGTPGTPIYTMRIQMIVPRIVDRQALRVQLERVAAELRVDLTLADRHGVD